METVVPTNNLHTFKRVQEDMPNPESVAEKADKEIGSLVNDPRWHAMQDLINGMIERIMALENIDEKDDLEAIGTKFMVSRLVKSQLEIIRDIPEAIANGATT